MHGMLKPLQRSAEFDNLVQGTKGGLKKQLIYGLSGSQRSYLLAALADEIVPRPLLVVTAGEREANMLADELTGLLPGRTVRRFPAEEALPQHLAAQNKEATAQRLLVLEELCSGNQMVIVAPVGALLKRLVPPPVFQGSTLRLAVGEVAEREELLANLMVLGYERVDLVEERGQFALRGGILDLFPMTAYRPTRLEFFDNEVDSIRRFNVQTQRSEEKKENLVLYPARELIISEASIWSKARKALTNEYHKQMRNLTQLGNDKAVRQLQEMVEPVLSETEGSYFKGMEQYLAFFYDRTVTLLDYLPSDSLLFVDEPVRTGEVAQHALRERVELEKELLAQGRLLPTQFMNHVDWSCLLKAFAERTAVFGALLPRLPEGITVEYKVSLQGKSLPSFLGKAEMLAEAIKEWRRSGYAVVLLISGRQKPQQLLTSLKEYQVDAFYAGALEGHVRAGNVVVTAGALTEGFELPSCRLVVIAETNIYGQHKKVPKGNKQVERMTPFVDLKVGDYVVHVNYGIGRYLGVVPLTIADIRKEYLLVKYAGEDKLYVPVDQVGLIQKYLGSEGEAPRLSRMGGGEWARAKSKVREAVREMAQELLALYAARETVPGYGFGPDTVWQQEFEEAFPYEETPDQIRAIEEVKTDMERKRPMDRLICGDVGYGKTEVALRAAFKAVMENKQVAVLVPTTILAQQHYGTFRERFAPYPIKVEVLSRFCTAREQSLVLQGLRQGTVDIVIGTHRLVQEDVRFKSLGLLIIDEEQRFGVAHKERLKFIRKNVDVLTLSATPIPRTLHMALVGLRDTSLLETPPKDRYPIQTYVLDEDPVLFRESIRKELGRGGQVFFVYNRVMDMDRVALWLQELVPEARIALAHGQMRENDLEQVMMEFLDGSYDVLVCTTIIENGLDISNVNTLLVKEADMMGLAQLYQLKGRVGRSSRLAYAYFTFKKDKVLGEAAEKRLAAIREFTELGSGFKIAMRDLEIRGAGNILGAEQHGHIAAVGFDLYCRLLDEAVKEARGEKVALATDTAIELPVEAYIPDTYITDTNQKVETYKRLASFTEPEQLADFEDELLDRFGDPPPVLESLLEVAGVKILAGRLRIKKISVLPGQYRLLFDQEHPLTGEALVTIGRHYLNEIKFSNAGEVFEIKLRLPAKMNGDSKALLKKLKEFLTVLSECCRNYDTPERNVPEVAISTQINV